MSSDKEAYYKEARHWALEAEARTRRHGNVLRALLVVLLFLVVIEGLAIVELIPLKAVEPIPVLVDRQSGYVQVLNTEGRKTIASDAAMTRSLLARYVTLRESYDFTTVGYSYHEVSLYSTGAARDSYLATMQLSNPLGPLHRYGRTALVDTRVDSVSEIAPQTAMVRFQTRRRAQAETAGPPEAWVAIVGYRYTDAAMRVSDRLINPLGFQVTRYRKDPEVLTEPSRPVALPAPSAPLTSHALSAAPPKTVPGVH